MGRFISEDPAADPNNPNLYVYAANNPLVYIDPTGCWNEDSKWYKPWTWFNKSDDGESGGGSPSGSPSSSGSPSVSPSKPVVNPDEPKKDSTESEKPKELLIEVVDLVGRTSPVVMRLVSFTIEDKFKAMAKEVKDALIPFRWDDGFRSTTKQSHFYRIRHSDNSEDREDLKKHGIKQGVNKPGNSFHEAGLAFDVDTTILTEDQQTKLTKIANKHGFYQIISNEPWHFGYVGEKPPNTALSEPALREPVAKSLGLNSLGSNGGSTPESIYRSRISNI